MQTQIKELVRRYQNQNTQWQEEQERSREEQLVLVQSKAKTLGLLTLSVEQVVRLLETQLDVKGPTPSPHKLSALGLKMQPESWTTQSVLHVLTREQDALLSQRRPQSQEHQESQKLRNWR
jgi:hypothetical protein